MIDQNPQSNSVNSHRSWSIALNKGETVRCSLIGVAGTKSFAHPLQVFSGLHRFCGSTFRFLSSISLLFALAGGACRSSHNEFGVSDRPRSVMHAAPLPVTVPPDSFFALVSERDREAARKFYKKYIDVKGMPAVASVEVADAALRRTFYIVTHMLAGRPDVVAAMVKNGMYLIIIGQDQVYTDMPEYRYHPDSAYQNERVRGTGGKPTSWRYAWLQKLPNVIPPPSRFHIASYYTKFTWAREFTVLGRQASDEALLKANDTIRKMFAYRHDILKALIADGARLVVLGPQESLADLPECQTLKQAGSFDSGARFYEYAPSSKLLVVSEENVLADPRQALEAYDPALYALVNETMAYDGHVDWRYNDRSSHSH